MDTTEKVLETYYEELKSISKLSEDKLRDIQGDLPSYKHRYAYLLVQHQIQLNKLKSTRKAKINELITQIQNSDIVTIPLKQAEIKANNTSTISKIDNDIRHHELIIEFLTKIEKNLSSLTFDIKNYIQIIQLET